jgi:carbon monoxide dehydrogenase subunit G
MRQEFREIVTVQGTPQEVWERVGDIPLVLSWISIVGEVREVEPEQRYAAVLTDRIGPFKLRADVDVAVLEREPQRSIRARGEGEDRQIGSRLVIDVVLELVPRDDGTAIDVSGSYEVTGRPASLGASSIRKKAAKVLDEFFASTRAATEG